MISRTLFTLFFAFLLQLCAHISQGSALNRPVRGTENDSKCGPLTSLIGYIEESKIGTYSLDCLRLRYNQISIINIMRGLNVTDIYIAAKKGYLGFVQSYVEFHPLHNELYHTGDMKLLYFASVGGNVDVLKYLIEEKKLFQFNVLSYNGFPALHAATQGGKLEAVRYFIETMNADVNMRDLDGDTPAHIASGVSLPILKYLIEKGADLTAKTFEDESLLHASAHGGNVEAAKFLVEEKHFDIELKDKYGETPLYTAVRRNNFNVVKYLAGEKKANLDVKDSTGKNLLHEAAYANNLELMKYLVDDLGMSSRIEEKDSMGSTVALEAVHYADLRILKYLADEKNANVETTDKDGLTPLHLAASENKFATVKYLVEEKGVDTKAKTNAGETAYDLAEKQGADLKVKLFLHKRMK